MKKHLNIAFFGSSIVSAYWNGAATYYRGIVKALSKMGHQITFYEPDIYERQLHRDIEDPEWCKVKIYKPDEFVLRELLQEASDADVVIKASGIGAFDTFLEKEVAQLKTEENLVIFWDVDAPATLDRIEKDPEDPFKPLIPVYDFILTYGGGQPVMEAYESLGAKKCLPIYNALDTETHFPVPIAPKYEAALAFLGNRLPDREKRVDSFFLRPAKQLSNYQFLLGGSGWGDKDLPPNVRYTGHVYTRDHNAFNSTPTAVLNISRDSMARYGFSPATRVFEAAGATACIITDYWEGIETFFEPGKEILIARNAEDVILLMKELTPEKAREIGEAAYKKVLSEHTYQHRANLLASVFSTTLKDEASITQNFNS